MLVRKVFDVLENIPDERINFHASFEETPTGWSKIMDEVWPQFQERPPTNLFVTIKDAPGDEQKSTSSRSGSHLRGLMSFSANTLLADHNS